MRSPKTDSSVTRFPSSESRKMRQEGCRRVRDGAGRLSCGPKKRSPSPLRFIRKTKSENVLDPNLPVSTPGERIPYLDCRKRGKFPDSLATE